MFRLHCSREVLLLGLLACVGVACGDDSGGGGGTDAGGTGGGGSDAGGTGGDGAGATGGKVLDAGNELTKAECLAMSVQTIPATCLDCACTADPEDTAQCGVDCWSLIFCVGNKCGGDITDFACIGSKCSAFASGSVSAMAMIASAVVTQCAEACVAGPGTDAGAEDAGQ